MHLLPAKPVPPALRAVWPVLALLLPLLAVPVLLPGGAGTAQAAEVTLLQPPAQVRHGRDPRWRPLLKGDRVIPGDRIRTGRGGLVEVRMGPQRAFRLGPASEIVVVTLTEEADGGLTGRLDLSLGRLWSSLTRALRERTADYQVVTATATMGIKGTRFNVDQGAPGEGTALSVIDGEVAAAAPPKPPGPPKEVSGPKEIAPPQEVTFEQWALIVAAEQRLIIRPDGTREVRPLTDADRAEEWIAFNLKRDAELGLEKPPPAEVPDAQPQVTPDKPSVAPTAPDAAPSVPIEAPTPK